MSVTRSMPFAAVERAGAEARMRRGGVVSHRPAALVDISPATARFLLIRVDEGGLLTGRKAGPTGAGRRGEALARAARKALSVLARLRSGR